MGEASGCCPRVPALYSSAKILYNCHYISLIYYDFMQPCKIIGCSNVPRTARIWVHYEELNSPNSLLMVCFLAELVPLVSDLRGSPSKDLTNLPFPYNLLEKENSCDEHYLDNWQNLNMDYVLDNSGLSMSNSLNLVITLWLYTTLPLH